MKLPIFVKFPLIPLPNKEATIAVEETKALEEKFPLIPLPNKEATMKFHNKTHRQAVIVSINSTS